MISLKEKSKMQWEDLHQSSVALYSARKLIDIGFEFTSGATITVEARDLFLPNGTPGTLCLGITRSVDDDMIIIGAISMQGYNIGYNLNKNTIHIVERKC